MAKIIPFPARGLPWSVHERVVLAEILDTFGAGFATNSEHGTTDEGDPWTVFYEAPHGSPVAHIAKEGRTYVLVCLDQIPIPAGDLSSLLEVVRKRFVSQ